MSALFEGDFVGKAVKTEVGSRNGKLLIRIEMEITEGERKGQRVSYEGKLTEDVIKYTKRDMIAVGWKGQSVKTFADDVKAANLTVPFTVRIASWQPPEPGRPLRQWSAVDRIGGGAKPLDALDDDKLKNVDKWFAEAGDVGEPAATGDQDGLPF